MRKKEGYFEVALKSPGKQNKANIELINLVAKYFNKPISCIRVVRGRTSRNKIIEIR